MVHRGDGRRRRGHAPATRHQQSSLHGYSLGAAVSLQVAIRHPELVGKLASVSVAFRADGDYPEVRQAFAQMPGMAAAIGQRLSASPLAQLYPDVDWETT